MDRRSSQTDRDQISGELSPKSHMLVSMSELAQLAGKKCNASGSAFWQPQDVPLAVSVLESLLEKRSPRHLCVIQGNMPQAMATALANAILPMATPAFVSSKPSIGWVEVPLLKPCSKGVGLHFRVNETKEFTLIEFSIPDGFIEPDRLPHIAPPVVNKSKGVVLAGHGPYWLMSAIGLAYRDHEFVAVRQFKNGATVAISSPTSKWGIGSLVPEEAVKDALKRAVAPKRGELWSFQGLGGPHPCIIISDNGRNAQLNDVIIVPITSHKNGFVHPLAIVLPESTPGLVRDSLAMGHKLTTIHKDQLIGVPLGTVNGETLQKIVYNIRRAVGA